MIGQIGAGSSDATRRAELIYAQARAQIDVRLWRAALGSDGSRDAVAATSVAPPLSVSTILELFTTTTTALPQQPEPPLADARPPATSVAMDRAAASREINGLGQNAGLSGSIASAANRAGIPPAVLASIIDAEAAKSQDGRWLATSRNPRSSAAGLGQFLSGTWKSEAERAGTWLNETAQRNGWLSAIGKVVPEAQVALLALRHDTDASINATADMARHTLAQLTRAGVGIGQSVEQIAKAAYLGHNLGIGDAITFLRGGLSEARARHLLDAQVGSTAATRRIAKAGGAGAAHHNWLTEFMDRRLKTSRFTSL